MSFELPELPEGYFWRVRELHLFRQPLLSIRRRIFFGLFSEEVLERPILDPEPHETWAFRTEIAARNLYADFLQATDYERFLEKAVGDYSEDHGGLAG